MDTPTPGLGNYELLMLLASGGMANVYAARQVGAAGFQRLVVVKRVHAHLLEDRSFYDMFRDEAAMASLVRHPNVVPVTDVVEADGELFLVMDYIEGIALSTVLKTANDAKVRVPPGVAVRIVSDALLGLHAAHEAVDMTGNKLELVHRDVSPHNVLVGVDGITRLIDFGIAKATHRSTQTRSGTLKGKFPYMSPEYAAGEPVDRRSDIFAAAIVLHETFTGRRLFHGENDLDSLRRVMEMPIPKASDLVPGLPPGVDAVLRQGLAREVEERFQTAHDFVDAIALALPPAPHREVLAFMQELCKGRLTERRNAIQSLLEGTLAPLSVRQARPGDNVTASHQVVRASGAPPPTVLPHSETPLTAGGSKGSLVTHDAPVAPPATSRGRFAAALVAVATLLVAVVWLASGSSSGTRSPASASAGAGASTAPPAAANPPPPSDSHAEERSVPLPEAGLGPEPHLGDHDGPPAGLAKTHPRPAGVKAEPPRPRATVVPSPAELHPSPYGP